QAKQQGRNTFKFFTQSMHEDLVSYHRLEANLKSAVKEGQFELLYQPQRRLADHRIEAVEALVHWKHPQRGLVSKSEFISAAEQSGCIVPIGKWVIEEVCRQLGQWASAGVPVPRIAINVAAAHFRQPDFHDAIRSVLSTYAIDPELI